MTSFIIKGGILPCPLGKQDALCTPHELYLDLGDDPAHRQERYRALFAAEVDGELLGDIRKTLNSGMALGNELFAAVIEKLTGRRMVAGKRGRPVGWRKQEAEKAMADGIRIE